MMRKLLCFVSLLLLGTFIYSQEQHYPQDYFSSPLTIPLLLSGNFGELRSNHFHAGIDIKTQGVEGHKVVASADGYVSRIKIQEGGYGKVLYIDHPNGYTTVYAHLQKFANSIADTAKIYQYKQESYTIDIAFQENQLPVKKGELIALSGNTGGSGGAHLHFEIRETVSEVPVNPLLFNFQIKDNISPVVNGLMFYPLGEKSTVNGSNKPIYNQLVKKGEEYFFSDTVLASGQLGLGIQSNDYLNNSSNRCGVYDLLLEVNEEAIYQYKTEKISFEESRYINAHCDYAFKKEKGVWIHKIFTLPNNGLTIYPLLINNGIINLQKDSIYQLKISLKDAYRNKTALHLIVKGQEEQLFYFPHVSDRFKKTFYYRDNNYFTTDSFKISLPQGALYDDLDFEYDYIPNQFFYSGIHGVHEFTTPIHKNAVVSIRCSRLSVNPKQMLVLRQFKNSKSYLTGELKGEWFEFETRYFGNFLITEDTKAPVVQSVNVSNGKRVSKNTHLMFKIYDDKSGIDSYEAYLNGKWVLMEYDYKKSSLIHYFDNRYQKGKNEIKVIVKDKVGNASTLSRYFFY